MIYTVTFNPAIDYVVHMDALELGTVNRTEGELIQFGGKGVNVSNMLRNLGVESVAMGFLAGFTGRAVEDDLSARGVRTDFVYLERGVTRINVKIKSAQETEINGRGPEIGPKDLALFFEKLSRLGEEDILVLAGSVPAGLPADIYEQICARLMARGVRTVVDAEGRLLQNVLPWRPFLIKPNRLELEQIFGRTLGADGEILECAAELQRQGARNVLVSMAGDGALLLDETGTAHRAAAPKGKVRNSVGAGDSMVAGFLAGWLRTGDHAAALRLGLAAGSATAFSEGLAAGAEVEELLRMM